MISLWHHLFSPVGRYTTKIKWTINSHTALWLYSFVTDEDLCGQNVLLLFIVAAWMLSNNHFPSYSNLQRAVCVGVVCVHTVGNDLEMEFVLISKYLSWFYVYPDVYLIAKFHLSIACNLVSSWQDLWVKISCQYYQLCIACQVTFHYQY